MGGQAFVGSGAEPRGTGTAQGTESGGRVGKTTPYANNPRNGNTARRVANTA